MFFLPRNSCSGQRSESRTESRRSRAFFSLLTPSREVESGRVAPRLLLPRHLSLLSPGSSGQQRRPVRHSRFLEDGGQRSLRKFCLKRSSDVNVLGSIPTHCLLLACHMQAATSQSSTFSLLQMFSNRFLCLDAQQTGQKEEDNKKTSVTFFMQHCKCVFVPLLASQSALILD